MPLRLTGIDWDALEPERLAEYWAALLGRVVTGLTLADNGSGFQITFAPTFQQKTVQNRVHLDLTSDSAENQSALVERAVELGGRPVDVGQGPDATHVVLADPEGNEFCIIEPGNTFLADTDFIGAVNCDGTRTLGQFWSRALQWPLVWDEHEETAIQSPDGGSKVTWSGPPLMPRPTRERMRFRITCESSDLNEEVMRLVSLGAAVDTADTVDAVDETSAVNLIDPDGNGFTLTTRA